MRQEFMANRNYGNGVGTVRPITVTLAHYGALFPMLFSFERQWRKAWVGSGCEGVNLTGLRRLVQQFGPAVAVP